jgi:DNA repair protein RecN (Recombination protein N)
VTTSSIEPVVGEARVSEIARMLGGERLSGTSRAHAQEMLGIGAESVSQATGSLSASPRPRAPRRKRP